jgi:hypothetical protein
MHEMGEGADGGSKTEHGWLVVQAVVIMISQPVMRKDRGDLVWTCECSAWVSYTQRVHLWLAPSALQV